MGLFSFLKNAGAKLFNKDKKEEPKTTATDVNAEQAAEVARRQKESLLKSIIENLKIPIEGLDVELHDDKITVYGSTTTLADKEKVILALGNVEGIAEVDDRIVVVPNEEIQELESRFHTVVKGDSLSKISKQYYGDYKKYMVIFEANKPMLKDPDLIYPGQVLRIPELQA